MDENKQKVKRKTKKKKKDAFQFSKLIIIFETLLVGAVTYKALGFIETALVNDFMGSLPYLTTLLSVVFAAYGTSVGFYYNKSKAENTMGGITYDNAMRGYNAYNNPDYVDYSVNNDDYSFNNNNIDCE